MLFKTIIGQRPLINKLTHAIDAGRIAHAQLFLGQKGTQNLALAIAYAQYANCTNHQYFDNKDENELHSDSCGTCTSCIKYENLAHPDLYFFYPNNTSESVKKDSKSVMFIEQWREIISETNGIFDLNDWYQKIDLGNKQGTINVRDCDDIVGALNFKSFEAKYKVIIIWMVDKLFHAAAPKILKVLEEPTKDTLFFLISDNQDQILNTILSRSQIVKIPRLENIDIADFLTQNYEIDEQNANNIACLSSGNLIEARNLITKNEDEELYHEKFTEWMRACMQMKIFKMNQVISELSGLSRERLKSFLQHSLNKLGIAFTMNTGNAAIVKLQGEELDFMTKFYPYIHQNNIEFFLTEIDKAIQNIERNANNNILLMDLSLQIGKFLKIKK